MNPTLQMVLTALGVGAVGSAGAIGPAVVSALRKLDAICHSVANMEQLTRDMAELRTQREVLLADGQAWGNRLEGRIDDLDTRVSALEQAKGTDPVVASRR